MDAPVIVVGAGPSGLMLAGELRLAGVRPIVLERLREPTGESRGLGFTARTMEVFDQRGLLPRLGDVETSYEGHFGGLKIDFSVLPGSHFGGKGIPQARTEQMLGEWISELGIDVRRGWEVTGLTDRGDHVELETNNGPLTAEYVVGCDGGRSTIRNAARFDFPGTAATMEMFIADVTGADIEPRMTGETRPGGMVMAGPLGDGVMRIVVCEKDRPAQKRTEAPEFAEVAAGWQRLTGQDISAGEGLWCTSFGNASRQVSEYRRGRVLLAGDAAHIHLPAGGQGMNVSIQDSVNLGWKLAAEVNGWAPSDLLDSYHRERHPVGERLLLNTRAQGLIFLSGDEVQPLRDVLTELIRYPEVSRHLAGMVSGLEIRYDFGSGEHPLLGMRMPKLELVSDTGKTDSTELLHTGHGVLLDFADDADLRAAAQPWTDRVDVITAVPHAIEDTELTGSTAMLIRPDGHVAWVAPGGGDATRALGQWFGEPRG